jgi:glyoxylase-like metal-dependent hydrolase (beta-lactamase superfamily II)
MTVKAVHHLNCATMCPIAGWLIGARGWRGLMVAHCLLVETARDGLVLIDTGFGTRDLEGKTDLPRMFKLLVGPQLDPAETALAQVQKLGFKPEDVRHVVVTHLDLDHAGGIADFPHAKVHLHQLEHIAATTRPTAREKNRYLPAHWSHGPKWELYAEEGDTWRGLPAVTRLRGIDADIGLVPMHGHTRGHSAIVVKSGDRWKVHAGDAYFHSHTVDGSNRKVPSGFAAFERLVQIDGAQRRASAAALRQLHASYTDLDLFCAHDPAEYQALGGV